MDYDILENSKHYEIVLENGKKYKVDKIWADNSMKTLDLGLVDVLDMWLEDNGVFENEEQTELDKLAKENKSVKVIQTKSDKPKTQRERVKKDNPDKEYIISCIAEYLEELNAENVIIANKTKIIEFTYNNKAFKLDLIEKRPPKAEK